jgi:putative ABC transport system permease protein
VNAVLVRIQPGFLQHEVAAPIRRWQRMTVYDRAQMESILVGKMIATSSRQIGMFLVILAVVSAAIVAFIIYTLTMDKIREIAVLKLIGDAQQHHCRDDPSASTSIGPDRICCRKNKRHVCSTPFSPSTYYWCPVDSILGFIAVMAICVLSSLIAIRVALRVDPAEAIGG